MDPHVWFCSAFVLTGQDMAQRWPGHTLAQNHKGVSSNLCLSVGPTERALELLSPQFFRKKPAFEPYLVQFEPYMHPVVQHMYAEGGTFCQCGLLDNIWLWEWTTDVDMAQSKLYPMVKRGTKAASRVGATDRIWLYGKDKDNAKSHHESIDTR